MSHGESIDHLFLDCSMTIELWYKFLRLTNLVWVPFRSVRDILTISFGGWGAWIGAKFYSTTLILLDSNSIAGKKWKDLCGH